MWADRLLNQIIWVVHSQDVLYRRPWIVQGCIKTNIWRVRGQQRPFLNTWAEHWFSMQRAMPSGRHHHRCRHHRCHRAAWLSMEMGPENNMTKYRKMEFIIKCVLQNLFFHLWPGRRNVLIKKSLKVSDDTVSYKNAFWLYFSDIFTVAMVVAKDAPRLGFYSAAVKLQMLAPCMCCVSNQTPVDI